MAFNKPLMFLQFDEEILEFGWLKLFSWLLLLAEAACKCFCFFDDGIGDGTGDMCCLNEIFLVFL